MNVLTAAATEIAVALARPAVMARPGHGLTRIARAMPGAARPDRAAARPDPKANADGPSAAPDRISAGAILATSVRPRARCRKLI